MFCFLPTTNDQRSNTFFLSFFSQLTKLCSITQTFGLFICWNCHWHFAMGFFPMASSQFDEKQFSLCLHYNLFSCMFCSDFGTRNISAWVNNVAFTKWAGEKLLEHVLIVDRCLIHPEKIFQYSVLSRWFVFSEQTNIWASISYDYHAKVFPFSIVLSIYYSHMGGVCISSSLKPFYGVFGQSQMGNFAE